MAVGGLIAVLAIARTVIKSALLIGGAFLMMSSGTAATTFSQFDLVRLGVGGAMVFVGLIFFRSGRRPSNGKSSDN